MFCVSLDQGFYECGFADTRRTDDSNDDGRSLFRQAVDKRNMESFFLDIVGADSLLGQSTGIGVSKGFGVTISSMFLFFLFGLMMWPIGLVLHCSKSEGKKVKR